MYSWSRSNSSSSRPARTFDRKPYAGKPRPGRDTSRWGRTERWLDPRQMRYQVIGRTTDESDLIVQISPAFYEYVRSMAHQWVKPSRVEDSRYNDRRDDRSDDRPQYGKFAHPFHKDPLYSKGRWEDEKRWWRLEQQIQSKKKPQTQWYEDDTDMSDIDAEMDDEYQMIKQWFANLNKNNTNSKRTVRSNNVKKK